MKRFLVFSGQDYYPSGGWEDFQVSHDTIEEAKAAAAAYASLYSWWHIVDTATGTIVERG